MLPVGGWWQAVQVVVGDTMQRARVHNAADKSIRDHRKTPVRNLSELNFSCLFFFLPARFHLPVPPILERILRFREELRSQSDTMLSRSGLQAF